jgi:hypothetical protein
MTSANTVANTARGTQRDQTVEDYQAGAVDDSPFQQVKLPLRIDTKKFAEVQVYEESSVSNSLSSKGPYQELE